MFTVYDSKIEAYLQPFYMQTTGAALRAFEESVNDTKTQFYKHAPDFTLFEIGAFNDATATINLHDAKISLGTAIEYLNEKAPQQMESVK